ncbi:phage major capsid protein [Polaribacter aestuariivivens]|uniref:phage major capsid protein n=1 Tax=Polaribacter aestuariivivens TaxID=2304626 RepID=UPI003F49B31A
MKFKEFLEKKGISMEKYEAMTATEVAKLQTEFADAQFKALKDGLGQMVADAKKGLLTDEQFKTQLDAFKETLKGIDGEKFTKFEASLEKYKGIVKTQGEELAKLKDGNGPTGANGNSFKKELEKAINSEDFKSFAESGGSKKASFTLKNVSISDDYTGTNHIATRDSRVVDQNKTQRLNIRDLLTVMPADLPYLAFIEVYDFDNKVGMNSENGELAESKFKVREAQVDAKRIGTHLPISKRMLKSLSFVLNFLMQKLPGLVKYREDSQLLFGDGAGNNVLGIFKVARDFTTLINTSLTGAAGAVSSIESYDGGAKTVVNFTANQNISNGATITFASATATGYNTAFPSVTVVNEKQIILDKAYVAEADTSEWTFSVTSPFKDSIDAAQEIDVLKVAKTLVTEEEYTATGIVLNPVDATKIETLKGSDEHYIDVKRLENGVLTIGGLPVAETTAMPAGKFAVGDFVMAAAIGQFTELTLEFSESTNEKLKNTVEAIVQEEILFPIYNKYMFVTGNFSTAKTAIGA